MIQPDTAHPGPEATSPTLYKIGCVGRITQLAETGDGRYLIQLTGVARFRIEEELKVADRLSPVPRRPTRRSPTISSRARARTTVDRKALLEALTAFLKANNLKADWQGIESAPNEALVNALAMMSPYGAGREAGAARGARTSRRAPRS